MITTVVFGAFHGADVFSVNHFPSTGGADGIKNLWTFSWYLQHNESWSNFEGMAAPFGEHICFIDGHPLLALVLRLFLRPLGLGGHGASILWMLVLASFLFTPIFLYQLYTRLKVNSTIAFVAAVAFTLLSPQILRMGGHYALAHTVALPLSWLLCLPAATDSGDRWRIVTLTVVNLVWLGTHAYLGIICTAFTLLYFLFLGIWRGFTRRILCKIIFPSVIPIGAFLCFVSLTDVHGFRVQKPYGFFDFTSSVMGLIAPQFGAFQFLSLPSWYGANWEGWSYIGMSTVLSLTLFTVFRWKRNFRVIRQATAQSETSLALIVALCSAMTMFLLSCGMPFSLVPDDWLLDWFPFVKQFRGIGRFSWPAYYVLTCSAVVVLSRFSDELTARGKPHLHWLLLFFSVTFVDVFFYQDAFSRMKTDAANPLTSPSAAMKDAATRMLEEQADFILPLPFYHKGSEVFGRADQGLQELHSLTLAQLTGVPMIAAHLTRASVVESQRIMAFLAPHDSVESVGNIPESPLIPNESKVVLINDGSPMQSDEAHWWIHGKEIYSCREFDLRIIEGNDLNRQWSDSSVYHPNGHNIHASLKDSGAYFKAPDGLPCAGAHIVFATNPDSTWLGVPLEAHLTFTIPGDLNREAAVNNLNVQFIVQTRTDDTVQWLALTTPKFSSHMSNAYTHVTAKMPFSLDTIPESIEFFVMGESNCAGTLRVSNFRVRELNQSLAIHHPPNQFN